jgi:hypothetical protein
MKDGETRKKHLEEIKMKLKDLDFVRLLTPFFINLGIFLFGYL